MEDKSIMYSLFGIIGIVIIVGLVMAISGAYSGMGVYSGGMRRAMYGYTFPYSQMRTVQGGVREVPGYVYPLYGVPVSESAPAYEYTQHAIYQSRYPGRIHTVLTSCRGQVDLGTVPKNYILELSVTEAYERFGAETLDHCAPAPHFEGKYCCEWATGLTSRIS